MDFPFSQAGGENPQEGVAEAAQLTLTYPADLPQLLRGLRALAAHIQKGGIGKNGKGRNSQPPGKGQAHLFQLLQQGRVHICPVSLQNPPAPGRRGNTGRGRRRIPRQG